MKNSCMTFKSVADLRRRFTGSPLEMLEKYVDSLDSDTTKAALMIDELHLTEDDLKMIQRGKTPAAVEILWRLRRRFRAVWVVISTTCLLDMSRSVSDFPSSSSSFNRISSSSDDGIIDSYIGKMD